MHTIVSCVICGGRYTPQRNVLNIIEIIQYQLIVLHQEYLCISECECGVQSYLWGRYLWRGKLSGQQSRSGRFGEEKNLLPYGELYSE